MNIEDMTFGVEIETYTPREVISGAGGIGWRRGPQLPGMPDGWKATTDGSLTSAPAGTTGIEYVSGILKGVDGLRSVMAMCAWLNEKGARVNSSCGIHIHVGFDRHDTDALERLIVLTANFEKAIFASTGTHRRERGTWCNSIVPYGQPDRVIQAQRGGPSSAGRYHTLNLTNLIGRTKPTVEFRAFSGSTNGAKIVSYVRLCLGLVERAHKTQRRTTWQAKPTSPTSPIKRAGEGATQATRLAYQLGWTQGRVKHVHGALIADDLPTMKESKAIIQRLARKYDANPDRLAV